MNPSVLRGAPIFSEKFQVHLFSPFFLVPDSAPPLFFGQNVSSPQFSPLALKLLVLPHPLWFFFFRSARPGFSSPSSLSWRWLARCLTGPMHVFGPFYSSIPGTGSPFLSLCFKLKSPCAHSAFYAKKPSFLLILAWS